MVSPGAPSGAPSFPPINSYAFLSDAHTAALVGPDLSVDWMCIPRFDGASVFAGMLDRHGGAFRLRIDAISVERSYVERSLVLRSLVTTPTGTLEVLDGLDLLSGHDDTEDPFNPGHVLLRLVRVLSGTVRFGVDVDARPDYARAAPDWRQTGPGAWRTEAVPGPPLELRTEMQLRLDGTRLVGEADLDEGRSTAFAVYYDGEAPVTFDVGSAQDLLARTCRTWHAWSASTPYDGIAWQEVEHSASVLRGLAYDVTGALVAATTTSLPEHLGGGRNWDYRYSWHRDSSLILLALFRLGHAVEGERFFRFLLGLASTREGRLMPMAGIGGEPCVEEVELGHLEGYAGSRPVRIGNGAFGQVQLDTYGHILDAVWVYSQMTDGIDAEEWAELRELVDTVAEQWQEPDHGLWEMRGPKRHYVNSKVMCWVALDRGIRMSEKLGHVPPESWRAARNAVHADVLEHGYDDDLGAFVMAYGYPYLDASVLQIPLIGFLPGDDPRVASTLDRLIEGLGAGNALLYRYDAAAVDDGVGGGSADGGEGAFLLSSFQLVSALVLEGRPQEARVRFERLLALGGPLGLYPEEMTVEGTALGNYPQAFTHLGLIEAALNLDDATQEETLRAWASRKGPATPG